MVPELDDSGWWQNTLKGEALGAEGAPVNFGRAEQVLHPLQTCLCTPESHGNPGVTAES